MSQDSEGVAGGLLAAALAYATDGLHVFPIKPGSKEPATIDGFKSASTDADQIREWWARWPDANVAIRTGSESGIVVLDVDPRHGGLASLEALKRKHGRIAKGPQVLTGSGGEHRYFTCPADGMRNSAGALGDGLDVRGEGGYVVAPPSVHENGNPYKWLRPFDRETLADPGALSADAKKRRNGSAPVGEIKPDGRFAWNVFAFDHRIAAAIEGQHADPAPGLPVAHTNHYSVSDNRVDITLDDGGTGSLWWATKNEWLGLLDVAGLRLEALYGGFAGEPLDDDSREYVFVARR